MQKDAQKRFLEEGTITLALSAGFDTRSEGPLHGQGISLLPRLSGPGELDCSQAGGSGSSQPYDHTLYIVSNIIPLQRLDNIHCVLTAIASLGTLFCQALTSTAALGTLFCQAETVSRASRGPVMC